MKKLETTWLGFVENWWGTGKLFVTVDLFLPPRICMTQVNLCVGRSKLLLSVFVSLESQRSCFVKLWWRTGELFDMVDVFLLSVRSSYALRFL
jgi:hypothetical protein